MCRHGRGLYPARAEPAEGRASRLQPSGRDFNRLLASFPHAFGGNPAISVGLDARQKRSGMTVVRAKAQIVPARRIVTSNHRIR